MAHTNPFGLTIQSVISLPGRFAAEGTPDVSIRYGDVPDSLPGAAMIRACTQARVGQFLLNLPRVAKYLVEEGRHITIQPAPGVSEDAVRLFLMGTVWSALLLQRGLLPLHGSCVQVGDKAVILAGHSGSGKSTLAATLMERGYPLVADELCALVIRGNQPPLVLPGFPQILLWAEALQKLEIDSRHLAPVRPGLEKYILPFQENIAGVPLPLGQVYILTVINTPSFGIVPLKGMNKFRGLVNNTLRVHHVAGLGTSASHFQQCTGAAGHIAVKRVDRPASPFALEELTRLLEEEF